MRGTSPCNTRDQTEFKQQKKVVLGAFIRIYILRMHRRIHPIKTELNCLLNRFFCKGDCAFLPFMEGN